MDQKLKHAYQEAAGLLLAWRNKAGIWEGRLSSSPLATAVAVYALYRVDAHRHRQLIDKGLCWLAEIQNDDGGWGDTDGADPSNLSTTLLCRSAFYGCQTLGQFELTVNKAERWIGGKAGSLEPASIVKAIDAIYGKDRTFAVPILTMCALSGSLGPDSWKYVEPLPFELAILPRRLFRWLRLSVVSYALPALIAVGQAKFHFNPPKNPFSRFIRYCVRNTTLTFLEQLQPDNGGFLEAAPLTAFVTMSLAAMGKVQSKVVRKGVDFLIQSVRADGSWPIDTDLATWLTTLSVNAFGEDIYSVLSEGERNKIQNWLLQQQFQTVHPLTGAASGGWGWTDKPGSVPDADDTAGVLIALYHLNKNDPTVQIAVRRGINWLLNLQNSDGGIPTFCRGWGHLLFDRSCPDITAHAILAWMYWQNFFDGAMKKRLQHAISKALFYLRSVQSEEGYWLPLWFGNPFAKNQSNPVYGTSRVLLPLSYFSKVSIETIIKPALDWLIRTQKPDGSWSADGICESSVEESALAMAAIASIGLYHKEDICLSDLRLAIEHGFQWMANQSDKADKPVSMGLYFSKLWYYNRIYRSIFTVSAFRLAHQFLSCKS